jgi:hypothetical protein
MPDHTPTPWEVGVIDPTLVYDADWRLLAEMPGYTPSDIPTDIRIANARRIVTCVNACEGLSTKALETTSLAGILEACVWLFEWLAEQPGDLGGCRDDLLKSAAILRGLLEVPNA